MSDRHFGLFLHLNGIWATILRYVAVLAIFVGILVVVFGSANVAARIMCAAIVHFAYGAEAYREGLRVIDWKQGILSDESELEYHWNFILGFGTWLLWVLFLFICMAASRCCRRLFENTDSRYKLKKPRLDPKEVLACWTFSLAAQEQGDSTRKQEHYSRSLTLTHKPTGLSVTGETPCGHCSKKDMQVISDQLHSQLLRQLEQSVAEQSRAGEVPETIN
jgi:hypothetical protein